MAQPNGGVPPLVTLVLRQRDSWRAVPLWIVAEVHMHSQYRSCLPRCRVGCVWISVLLWGLIAIPQMAVADQSIHAAAPFEVLAPHLHEPTGLAWDPATGELFIAESGTGSILRLDRGGGLHTHVTGFKRPRGLAWDPRDASLLVVDEKAGTLCRISATKVMTVLRDDLTKPQWVAVAEDGTIYLTAEAGAGFKVPGRQEGVLLAFGPDGASPRLLVKALKDPGGLRVFHEDSVRFLADRLRTEPAREGGTVFEWTPGEPLEVLIRAGFKDPQDLAIDALDATYLTAEGKRPGGHHERGIIGKAFADETVALFATGLRDPQGITLDALGHLYVAETEAGRILRFRAPAAPTLDPTPPLFTKEATLLLTGKTDPHALLSVRGGHLSLPPQGNVTAQIALRRSHLLFQRRSGLFLQRVVLTNTGGTPLAAPLAIVVPSIRPAGVSLANATTSVHGNPAVEVPLVGGLLRPGESARVFLHFRPPTESRHVAHLTYTHEVWALQAVATSDAEGNFSLPVTLTPNTEHHLALYATGHLGLGLTSVPTRATVTHDDTRPGVSIVSGPPAETGASQATFTFTGSDNFTPADALTFAWALDGGAFSAFQPAAPVTLGGLTAGPHAFRVMARDQAGNETQTPATWTFTVRSLSVSITEPRAGQSMPEGMVLVRGTVETGGAEVGVVVNGLPAAVQGGRFALLLPITPEVTSLTAVATTVNGASTSASIPVSVVAASPQAVVLEAFPPGGPPPLTVTFSVQNNTGRTLVSSELDVDGNGTVDLTSATTDNLQATYTTPGHFLATLRALDDQNQSYTARTLIAVSPPPALVVKWEGLKEALRRGDVPAALSFIHSTTRERYRQVFDTLPPDRLALIDQYLTTIEPVEIGYNGAEYQMRRQRGGDTLSFPVWFQVDADGIWRLVMF
jgi:sugar lactone lactonase YvrE